jgi:hypothetical protein
MLMYSIYVDLLNTGTKCLTYYTGTGLFKSL